MYEKQNFSDGSVLTAEQLNHMETGIAEVHDALPKKLTKPETAKVGDYLRVKAVNEDGSMVLEAVELPAGEGSGANLNLTVETITVGEDSGGAVPVTGITLDYTSLSLKAGDMMQLAAMVTPGNATNTAVIWETSDGNVATVSDGLVTARAEGNAVITARSAENSSITAACAVSVTAAESGGETAKYAVTNDLTNVTTNNSATSVNEGASYAAVLTADTGYVLGVVTVTMGGVDITTAAVSGGAVSIASVTGDIVITATATAEQSGGTVYFKNSPYTLHTGALMKPNGTTGAVADGAYLEIPYVGGIKIATCMNPGWSTGTYPHYVVLDGGVYTPVVGEATGETAATGATQYSATFTGYSDAAVIYVNMNKYQLMQADGNASANVDTTQFYYYIIPGGES